MKRSDVPTLKKRRVVSCVFLSLVAVVIGLGGCGGGGEIQLPQAEGDPIPVKGKVLLAGGRPLENGTVFFVPVKEPGIEARGTTDATGIFELTSRKPGDGALPGDYKVRIEPPPAKIGSNKAPKPPFPAEYMGEDSGLVATVAPGKTYEFNLSASSPGGKSVRRGRSRDDD